MTRSSPAFFNVFVQRLLLGILVAGVFCCGCRSASKEENPFGGQNNAGASSGQRIIKPLLVDFGRVVSKNEELNFVVVEFESGNLPPVGKLMGVYRQGEKVGVIKISGPQQSPHTIGDIKEGFVKVGDEVRPE